VATKFSNNAFSTLSAGINGSVTTFDVASTSTFPDITDPADHMYLTIVGSSDLEIVKVTGLSGSTYTCVRGQDGTSGIAANGGDRVELRVTSAMLTDALSEAGPEHIGAGFSIAMSIAL
jgi:hypothetical protein